LDIRRRTVNITTGSTILDGFLAGLILVLIAIVSSYLWSKALDIK